MGLVLLRLWGGDCENDEARGTGNAEARLMGGRKRYAKDGETSQLSLSQQNVYRWMYNSEGRSLRSETRSNSKHGNNEYEQE
jgi:hypothetical protein